MGGQRSNQLNYVPLAKSMRCEITSVYAALHTLHTLHRLPKATRIAHNPVRTAHKMESGTPILPMSCSRAATSTWHMWSSGIFSFRATLIVHSVRRVLCTPVLMSLRSRSWLNAQIRELRNARCCSSSSLMRMQVTTFYILRIVRSR
jgi:hypothetical protein